VGGGDTGIWNQSFMLTKRALYCLSHTSVQIFSSYFGDWVSWTICLVWPWTVILLISTKITGVSHQCLAKSKFT
jgi:hypothetical protein